MLKNLMSAALLVACSWMDLAAQSQCGLESVRGKWAFSEIGWSVLPGSATADPVTVMGVVSIDYTGQMSGSGTWISGAALPGTPLPAGAVIDFDFTGSVSINSDCTGSWRYTITVRGMPGPLPREFIERIVYAPQTDEIVSMSVQSALSKPLWIGSSKRLSKTPGPISWPDVPLAP